MDRKKTDESVKAGLQLEAGYQSGQEELNKESQLPVYTKDAAEGQYEKRENSTKDHYDKK